MKKCKLKKIITNDVKFYVFFIFLSLFITVYNTSFINFIIWFFIDIISFISIYYIIKNHFISFLSNFTTILIIIPLLGIILFSGIYAYFSSVCISVQLNITAKNIFTKNEKIYCDIPPWYTVIDDKHRNENDGGVKFKRLCKNINKLEETSLKSFCSKHFNILKK